MMFYEYARLNSPDYLEIEEGTDFNYPEHLHICFEIIIILSGQMEVTVDKNVFVLTEGEALLIFPHQLHNLKSDKSSHILGVFSPFLVSAFYNDSNHRIPRNHKFKPDGYLIEAFKNLQFTDSVIQKKGVLYLFCSQFYQTGRDKWVDSSPENTEGIHETNDLLYRIFDFVEKNYSADCTLYELSRSLGYNHAYLSRFFKKATNITFNTYMNRFRLNLACYLLTNTNDSVLNCALQCGYQSIRTFNHNFKESFGMTPEEYRSKNNPLP